MEDDFEDSDYEDYYEEEEERITCATCGTTIYPSDPCSWDRQGNALCETCAAGLVEVRYAHYHSDGKHFDTCVASIPPEDVVTLYLEIYPKRIVAGITLQPYVSTRQYDKTNLPVFVELYEGSYRYVPGKRIKF